MYEFRWITWNVEHIAEHGLTPEEAESVVRSARAPYPRGIGNKKILVRGQTASGMHLQVIFIVDPENTLFVIHARPLTEREKRRLRRSSK